MKTPVFIPWIKKYGPRKLANDLDVHPSTIRKWRQGVCPRPEHMRRIRELSKGFITYTHIIDEAFRE